MLKFKLERMNKLPVSINVHTNIWAYLLAMDDPDYPEGDEFVDDDLPLPGTISRVEFAKLMEDMSDEEWDFVSKPARKAQQACELTIENTPYPTVSLSVPM